jgi:hypothetical protein
MISQIQTRIQDLEIVIKNASKSSSLLTGSNDNSSSSNGKRDEEDDAVEVLVLEARAKEATASLKMLKREESGATSKLKSIEILLKIATPALQSFTSSCSRGTG